MSVVSLNFYFWEETDEKCTDVVNNIKIFIVVEIEEWDMVFMTIWVAIGDVQRGKIKNGWDKKT